MIHHSALEASLEVSREPRDSWRLEDLEVAPGHRHDLQRAVTELEETPQRGLRLITAAKEGDGSRIRSWAPALKRTRVQLAEAREVPIVGGHADRLEIASQLAKTPARAP